MSNRPFAHIAEPPAPLLSMPWLRLGFRPFYLLAALFAVLSVPLWLLAYTGHGASLPNLTLLWHMHEMSFGFIVAVVIGFLYTAARNWTDRWTPRGRPLALLAGLWLAGRIAMLLAPPAVAAAIDLLFLPVSAWPLYRVLKQAGNTRNLPMPGLLLLLALANGVYHAAALGWLTLSPLLPIHAALLIVVLLATMIGGRVLPGFTKNMAPGSLPYSDARLDRAGMLALVLAAVTWLLLAAGVRWMPAPLAALACASAGLLLLWRLSGWCTLKTLRYPLLWILHCSYGWIGVGMLLLAAAALGLGTSSSALHALTVGALSGLIIGMITRTALGHTGRPLRAGRAETAAFLLLQGAALLRLAANLTPLAAREALLWATAGGWCAAFAVYLWVYAPYLLAPRLDGKDG
ncbi:MAG: NnrS family protein [Sphingomonadaceae bacterium]